MYQSPIKGFQSSQLSILNFQSLPLCLVSACMYESLLLGRLLAVQFLDDGLSQFLGETQLEDDAPLGLFHLAVRRTVKGAVSATRIVGIGAKMARAIILRQHASSLAGASSSAYDVLAQLKAAGVDVDVPIGIKYCLRLHVEIFDENLFCFLHS